MAAPHLRVKTSDKCYHIISHGLKHGVPLKNVQCAPQHRPLRPKRLPSESADPSRRESGQD